MKNYITTIKHCIKYTPGEEEDMMRHMTPELLQFKSFNDYLNFKYKVIEPKISMHYELRRAFGMEIN